MAKETLAEKSFIDNQSQVQQLVSKENSTK